MDRVKTGITGLDQLLYGGFLRGDAILVAGAPGTGKTSLGMQFIYNGITKYQEPGLFITFEEFPQRIYRDAASFGWDLPALEEEGKLKVMFTSPEVLQQDVIQDNGLVGEMVREIGARRVVIDSITNLRSVVNDDVRFREATYGLINALKRDMLTTMLTQELGEHDEIGTGPEEFVADAVVRLTRDYVGNHHMRFVEVIKSRGSPQIAIPSLYTVSKGGITVLPPFQEPLYRFEESVSTGIPQLDELLGGGIPYGSFYLMEVDSGINQDIFDVGFAREALESGDSYLRIAAASEPGSRWRMLMELAGEDERLEEAIKSEKALMLWPGGTRASEGPLAREEFRAQVDHMCKRIGDRRARVQVDITELLSLLPPDEGYRPLAYLTSRCRERRAVMIGVVSPGAVVPDQLEKLRTAADGIVRVWTKGSYAFLQVQKTVNSARTPVYAIRQIQQPPFIEIVVN